LKKTIYKPLGFLFLGLAILGIVLPILPGTPFLLLSAWFFARSSEKWHQRLLASDLFGPLISNWEQHRCISRRTKGVAIVSMVVAGGASVIFGVDSMTLKLVGLSLMGVGTVTLLSIRTCECEN
jgi:uncharacterized membrane protein YbaN (DUF454 family)